MISDIFDSAQRFRRAALFDASIKMHESTRLRRRHYDARATAASIENTKHSTSKAMPAIRGCRFCMRDVGFDDDGAMPTTISRMIPQASRRGIRMHGRRAIDIANMIRFSLDKCATCEHA